MKKKTVLILIVAVVGGAITLSALKPKDPTKVVTAKAEKVPELKSIVSATGELRAKEFVDIQAEVPGVITELLVREGDVVKQGDVLLRIEDLQFGTEVDSARAQVGAGEADARNAEVGVATAHANLAGEKTALAGVKVEFEQARISRDRAEQSFRRKEEMFQSHLIGGEEYEIAVSEARLAQQRFEWNKARIEQAEANVRAVATRVDAAVAAKEAACSRVEAAKAGLARVTDVLSKTVIKSPLSGLITKLNVEKGERAVPGIQSNPISTLMTIADMSVIEAEIQVDEADIVHVTIGAPAEVELDAIRDTKFPGVVTEIGQSPIQTVSQGNSSNQEGKDFKVVVRLASPPPTLRPGFTATADIVTAVRTDCLTMLLQALTRREVEVDAAGNYVAPPEPAGGEDMTVHASRNRQNQKELDGVFLMIDGRARFRPVKTGITGDMDIEVLEGLVPGDEVVSGPYQVLRTLKEWDHIAVDEKRQSDDRRLQRKRR
ncbi:MAG TPA: efflux RND transporter periplasmic adaptor subunit [Planctomycetota bacterium]|nr:efflux RND transporter periplasmic adaptor subunit [Planctomycetota bacterium]